MASCMTSSMELFPLLMERVGMVASTLAGILVPTAALVGSLTKLESSSRVPPIMCPVTVQSWTLPLPSILTVLPGLAWNVDMDCAIRGEAAKTKLAMVAVIRINFIDGLMLVLLGLSRRALTISDV